MNVLNAHGILYLWILSHPLEDVSSCNLSYNFNFPSVLPACQLSSQPCEVGPCQSHFTGGELSSLCGSREKGQEWIPLAQGIQRSCARILGPLRGIFLGGTKFLLGPYLALPIWITILFYPWLIVSMNGNTDIYGGFYKMWNSCLYTIRANIIIDRDILDCPPFLTPDLGTNDPPPTTGPKLGLGLMGDRWHLLVWSPPPSALWKPPPSALWKPPPPTCPGEKGPLPSCLCTRGSGGGGRRGSPACLISVRPGFRGWCLLQTQRCSSGIPLLSSVPPLILGRREGGRGAHPSPPNFCSWTPPPHPPCTC